KILVLPELDAATSASSSSVSTSGRPDLNTQKARINNTVIIPIYGGITCNAIASSADDRSASVILAISDVNASTLSSFKNTPKIIGATAPANLLQIPIILIRFAALSGGPTIVMYGLEAVCKIAKPLPMINKPNKNSS